MNEWLVLFVAFFSSLLLGLASVAGFLYAVYWFLTLPMRRNERARFFLDLLELGLKNGRTPEQAVLDAASSRDGSLGIHFFRFANALGKGLTLAQALNAVPRLVPPQVGAMLRAGIRLGDLQKLIPVCRQTLRDGVSQVRGALNYLLLFALVLTPASLIVPVVLRVKVLPKFMEVFRDLLAGHSLPALTRFVFGVNGPMFLIQVILLVTTWCLLIGYIGGPRWRKRFNAITAGFPDRLEVLFPWRRKRLQRDFSATLAILLDAGLPEAEAVTLASESTANQVLKRRAQKVVDRLKQGAKLTDALREADDSPELQWRFANAARRGGFLRALSGWHEALDNKAFQLEQAAAQVTTTALVLINGLVIGLFIAGMFVALIHLLNQAVLW